MASSKYLKKFKYALRFLPDEQYIKLYYFLQFKKKCNLKNPVTFNEKLNWLKLHDRNAQYTTMVDKYEAKKYVEKRIGGGYTIPTLGVWNSFDEIDFDLLPNQFVLKCTHDSEGLVIVKSKEQMNKLFVKKKLEAALKQNFYYIGREWPYKNVKPRIIAEQYMEDHRDGELRDYKFFCFNGEPKMMYIASDRSSGHVKFDYYDLDFNHMDLTQKYPNASQPLRKPDMFDEMVRLSTVLSEGFPHIRVDWYEVDGKLYFGEFTFYHLSGFMPFNPPEWDKRWGDWIELSKE